MLNSEQFAVLNQHLNNICHSVPYKWGRMQTKEMDRKLPKLYEYETYDELNAAISHYAERKYITTDDEQNNYYRHRWYVFRCSLGDEYLFKSLPDVIGVENNPWFDFTLFNRFNLDLKGTVILRQYKDDPEYVFRTPLALIDSLYKQQSQDFRYRRRLQNRLFLVHHSFIDPSREPVLRAAFDVKKIIFEDYAKLLSSPNHKLFDYYYDRNADIIFFVEKPDGTLEYGFGSENLKGAIKFKQLSTKLT